ncbi:hypothetical protein LINGRAHAP2_LOCUS16593 [Linum grandiflorum]
MNYEDGSFVSAFVPNAGSDVVSTCAAMEVKTNVIRSNKRINRVRLYQLIPIIPKWLSSSTLI